MEIEKSSGAVVFYRGDAIAYLLLLSTYWGFPKGRVEEGEDEETTARREVREETGLDVQILEEFRWVDDYWYQRKGKKIHKQAVYFSGEASNRDAKISWEHEDMIWLPYEAALAKLKFKGLKDLLVQANEFIIRRGRV